MALVIAIVAGFVRRNRRAGGAAGAGVESPNTVAQWTEGETTRLLSSAELPGPKTAWCDDQCLNKYFTTSGPATK